MSYNLETTSAKENRSPFALLETKTTNTLLGSLYLQNSTADWISINTSGAISSTGTCFHSACLSFAGGQEGAGSSSFGFYANNGYNHLTGYCLKAGTYSNASYADQLGSWHFGNASFYGVGSSLTLTKNWLTSSGVYTFTAKKPERCRSLVRRLSS